MRNKVTTPMIEFSCPGCNKRYRVKDELAGRNSKCKVCGGKLVVPQAADGNGPDIADILNEVPLVESPSMPSGSLDKNVPVGIWRTRNYWNKPVLILDAESVDPATFPLVCIYRGTPVSELRPMIIQDQDTKTAGNVVRHSVSSFGIDLPISDEAYAHRVNRLVRLRRLLFLASFLVVLIGSSAGAIAEYYFKVTNASIAIPISMAPGLVLFVIAVMFPHMEDSFSDPNVIFSIRVGSRFSLFGIHENFLKLIPILERPASSRRSSR